MQNNQLCTFGHVPPGDALSNRATQIKLLLKDVHGSGLGKVETHSKRYAYRLWLDAVAVPFAAQPKSIRCAVLCPTMNVYGDIATDEMSVASAKVADLKINGKLNDRYGPLGYQKNGGSEWGSNPPVTGLSAARRF